MKVILKYKLQRRTSKKDIDRFWVYFLGGRLKEINVFRWERILSKEFVLKIVPNMESRDKDKPSEGSEYYIKVLSKS
jgi:hypothetical protein